MTTTLEKTLEEEFEKDRYYHPEEKSKAVLTSPEKQCITTLADSECFLCIQHDADLKERIVLYTYRKEINTKKIIGVSSEGQTYTFKDFAPRELHELAVSSISAILVDNPLETREMSDNIFKAVYSYTEERKAGVYEGFRDFHQAFNK